jgi:glycosyltransferase involved in cell wall biosynthesis
MNRAEKRRRARNGVEPIAGLWVSNAAFAPTGYGTQTQQVVSRMVKDGHRMAVAANYGLEAIFTQWEGIEHFPRGFEQYSNDMIHPYFLDWSRQNPNYRHHVFTLYDVWVFNHPRWDEMPVVSWVPIDHMPIPPKVTEFLKKPNVFPIAMSKFGAGLLQRAELDHAYIPHAIDTQLFKPTPEVVEDSGKRRTGRQMMGDIPEDAFVVGIVNANKGTTPVRKAFDAQLLAFSIFAEKHDDAILFLHTERYGGMAGIALDPLIQACGIPDEKIRFVNQYQLRIGIPQEVMAALYSGMDCLLSPTLGEGFGITVIEAQACETPVIVNNFSAQPELISDGVSVQGQPIWDAAQQAWFQMPLVADIVQALELMYERKGERSSEARRHVVENYDADKVYADLWRPLLEDLP